MPPKVYKQIIQKAQEKIVKRKTIASELDMNSVREDMFLITKDTKIVYLVDTHFKSFSRKLHFKNIFTSKKSELIYEVTVIKHDDEMKRLQNTNESRKAEKARKAFVVSYDLIKDTVLVQVLEAKIKRNNEKKQTKDLLVRKKELVKGLLFVQEHIKKRKAEKKKRVSSYDED
jgi:hypothetical protein